MKYKIYIDTNQIFSRNLPLEELFSSGIKQLISFLKTNELDQVSICIPEIVLKERIHHRLEEVDSSIKAANKIIVDLRSFGHELGDIEPLKNYEDFYNKKADKVFKQNNLQLIPYPKVGADELVDRAIRKLKPFNDKGAGFKDTLIFLSILEDARSEKDDTGFIFCTNNSSDFDQEVSTEFKKETGKDLFVVPSVENVKEKLDELIPLNQHLEKRNQQIRDLVYQHIGHIMERINSTLSDISPSYPWSSINRGLASYGATTYASDQEEEVVIAYTYRSMDFVHITELGQNNFLVDVNVQVQPVNSTRESSGVRLTSAYESPISFSTHGRLGGGMLLNKSFTISLSCDLDKGAVKISNGRPSNY